jgi:hypothetical protein
LATILEWIRNHDESWLFVVIYIGFAVVLSVWLSLFWLVLMVGVHLLFEVIRHAASQDRWLPLLSIASWEVRVDVALVLLAFAVSLYMDPIMWALGLQSAGRAASATAAASRVGARAVAWQRMVRGVVLGFDDVANAVRAVFMRKGAVAGEADGAGPAPELPGAPRSAPEAARAPGAVGRAGPDVVRAPGWASPWSFWDRMTMGLCGACFVAMLAAPPLTDSSYGKAVETLREELRPFPSAEKEAVNGPEGEDSARGAPGQERGGLSPAFPEHEFPGLTAAALPSLLLPQVVGELARIPRVTERDEAARLVALLRKELVPHPLPVESGHLVRNEA